MGLMSRIRLQAGDKGPLRPQAWHKGQPWPARPDAEADAQKASLRGAAGGSGEAHPLQGPGPPNLTRGLSLTPQGACVGGQEPGEAASLASPAWCPGRPGTVAAPGAGHPPVEEDHPAIVADVTVHHGPAGRGRPTEHPEPTRALQRPSDQRSQQERGRGGGRRHADAGRRRPCSRETGQS